MSNLWTVCGLTFVLFWSPNVQAAKDQCAKVTIANPKVDRCSDLEVTVDFQSCAKPWTGQQTAQVHCESLPASAVVTVEDQKFTAELQQETDAWAAASWKVAHARFRTSPKRTAAATETEAPPATEKGESTPASATSSPNTAWIAASGFVDGQVQYATDPTLSRGFLLNDAAIYVTPGAGASHYVDAKIDLPFRLWSPGSADFEFAKSKAQAYAGMKDLWGGFRWKIGQFDTTYGFEGNDTVDSYFTRQGNIYNFTDPFVHLGLQAGYDFSFGLTINGLVGATNDTGTLLGKNPQFGLQVLKSGDWRVAAGGLLTLDPSTSRYNYYFDASAGFTWKLLAVDAEVSYNYRNDRTNPETGQALQGLGALLHTVFTWSDKWFSALRAEYIQNFSQRDPRNASSAQTKDQVLVFVGPQFEPVEHLRLKLDYSLQVDREFAATANWVVVHGLQFAAVYRL